jgi:hypothetical protein
MTRSAFFAPNSPKWKLPPFVGKRPYSSRRHREQSRFSYVKIEAEHAKKGDEAASDTTLNVRHAE